LGYLPRDISPREYTKIIEINPLTNNIIWYYHNFNKEDTENFLYSHIMGSAQRLSNGNTLFTNSFSGEIIEVTKKKEIVWKYVSPRDNMNIYRAYRLSPEEEEIYYDYIEMKTE
jgi:hypothetical protein